MSNEIYNLTNQQRYAALAILHQKWGNAELAFYYEVMAGGE